MNVDHHSPAVDLAAALRRGGLSGRELLETYLDRIARLAPRPSRPGYGWGCGWTTRSAR